MLGCGNLELPSWKSSRETGLVDVRRIISWVCAMKCAPTCIAPQYITSWQRAMKCVPTCRAAQRVLCKHAHAQGFLRHDVRVKSS